MASAEELNPQPPSWACGLPLCGGEGWGSDVQLYVERVLSARGTGPRSGQGSSRVCWDEGSMCGPDVWPRWVDQMREDVSFVVAPTTNKRQVCVDSRGSRPQICKQTGWNTGPGEDG